MLKQYEELSVLEQGDDGAIVSIRGQGGPSVLLGPAYLGHLELVLRKVEEEFDRMGVVAMSPVSGTHLLYMEVKTLLATYNETCNKFEGAEPEPKTLAIVLEELAEMRAALARLS